MRCFHRLAADHPQFYSQSQQAVVTPLPEYWTGSARLHLWIMLGASFLLLMAALISAGNLFLSRAMARRREIATRTAIGAQRWQIVAQFGAEGTAAGLAAAAAGLAMAQWAIRVLVKFAPADIPRLADAGLRLDSFTVAAAGSVLAAVACSVLPAWFAIRPQARTGKKAQSAFLFAQAAVTMTLLAMSAYLVLSYRSLMTTESGFAHRDAVSMNLALHGSGLFPAQAYTAKARHEFYKRLLDRLRESPGVTSAAAVLVRPLEGAIGWERTYQFEFEAGDGKRELPKANYEVVTPQYFETVGTPLLEGRDFDATDSEREEGVLIISKRLAERIRRAGHEPLGYRMRFAVDDAWMKVIGVVGDAHYRSITKSGGDLFVPDWGIGTNYVVIRGTRPAGELATLVRQTLASMDPGQAVASVATIGELLDRDTARSRFNMVLLLWFGVCAAILAATGIYSVIAEGAAARQREIAIKNALGAGRVRLVRDMVAAALAFVIAGAAAGIAGAVALGTAATDVLYGISPRDPVILGGVLLFLMAISAGASVLPAWNATRDVKFP